MSESIFENDCFCTARKMAFKAILRCGTVIQPSAGRLSELKHLEYKNDQNRSNHGITSSYLFRDE